jgi:hypothetical protein
MTSNKSEVVEVALVSYIDFCLFERFLCEGFCLAVKEQVVDKEEWLDINHWPQRHSHDEIFVGDKENKWLDIEHIICPEPYSSDESFVGLDAEEPVFYEKDENDIYDIICPDCPSNEAVLEMLMSA